MQKFKIILLFLLFFVYLVDYSNALDKTNYFIDKIEYRFIKIPKGNFQMGLNLLTNEKKFWEEYGFMNNSFEDETPSHYVELSKIFFILIHEVTQVMYSNVMLTNPSFYCVGDNLPVCDVTWDEANEFCKKLSKKIKKKTRLPTEAEWEYCCKAGSKKNNRFYWEEGSDSIKEASLYCNYSSDSPGNKIPNSKYNTICPVMSLKPNLWGLYDMLGNVSEWCGDWYNENYYNFSPKENPQGPSVGKTKVLRGGNKDFPLIASRITARWHQSPSRQFGGSVNGFRIVFDE
ncbi:MAG TPA: hypothetical protein DC057_12730 [Spirochaetia bacterium]|nr:hypothetical protein [Spirochaetia bacterium]